MINSILRYLDLQSDKRQLNAVAQDQGIKLKAAKRQDTSSVPLPVIPQYIALVSGVTIQPYLAAYQTGHDWDFRSLPGWLIFALIVALTIFPAVYKKTFDSSSSLFVQLCTIFSSGMGWQSLFATAITSAKH